MPPHSRSSRRRQPVRLAGQNSPSGSATMAGVRRPNIRLPEPVDYSLDYAYARSDLLRILLWGALLFAGMFVFYFVR